MLKKATFLLIILAFVLRIFFIFSGGVSFHYDMARDAFAAQQIWKDYHLKILGPPTSTEGLYHGVLYYYLIAPFYMLGKGDPRVVAIFLSFINSLAVIPIMFLAKSFFHDKKWIILSGLLFAVSFEGVQYGPWISNPQPAVLTVSLLFLSLYLWSQGKTYGLYLAVLFAALSSQFQFFLIYLFVLVPLFGIFFKIRTSVRELGISSLIAFLGLINFFVAAIKFNAFENFFFGLLNIQNSGVIDFRSQFGEVFLNYINRFSEIFIFNFFPTNVFIGGALAFIVLYAVRKQPLLLFFLLSNIPIFVFGGHTNTYVNIGLALPAILSLVYLMQKVYKINRALVFIIVLLSLTSNLYAVFKYSQNGQVILVIPNDMNLKNELALIDESYKKAGGKPFSVNTLTLPLWTNTTWAYLYSWYGKSKYGYTPYFYGRDQIGLLGVNSLKKIEKPLDKTFFIIEPADGIPMRIYNDEIDSENGKTKLLNEIDFGSIRLQTRIPKSNE